MAWLHAPIAKGPALSLPKWEVVGAAAGHFGPRVGVALPVAHNANRTEAYAEQRRSMVTADMEQAVISTGYNRQRRTG